MAAPPTSYRDREFLAVIGDEVRFFSSGPGRRCPVMGADFQCFYQDTVTGMLLAGIGVSCLTLRKYRRDKF